MEENKDAFTGSPKETLLSLSLQLLLQHQVFSENREQRMMKKRFAFEYNIYTHMRKCYWNPEQSP